MNASLVNFALQAIVRLTVTGREAAEQRARNRDALLPGLDHQKLNRRIVVNAFFTVGHEAYVAPGGPLQEFWDGTKAKAGDDAVDHLYVAALRISAEAGVDYLAAMTPAGAALLAQFDPGKGPLSPFARIALTAADVVLEYLAANPAAASDDVRSQQLIGAFAASMAGFLPDDGDFGPRENFGTRLAAGFLRAGLATVNAHPDWLLEEAHLTELLNSALPAVIAEFPDSIAGQVRWQRVADAIAGPAASAVLATIAANPAQFLGDRFDADRALGAVTQAVLLEAADDGLRDAFSRDALLGVYRSVLNVAASRPELFFDGAHPDADLARAALAKFAGVLSAAPAPFERATGIALASAAIEFAGTHAALLADPTDGWQVLAVDVFEQLTTGFAGALARNQRLGSVFGRDQLTEIGRTILTGVAANPSLVARAGQEWHGVIAAVAAAMAADTRLLLGAGDWRDLASVAAREAAANPARLFDLSDGADGQLASQLLTTILDGAARALTLPRGAERSVLAGGVLRDALTIALQSGSGHASAIRDHLPLVRELVDALNALAVDHHLDIGGKEWLALFRALLVTVLDGTAVGDLTIERANELLQGS